MSFLSSLFGRRTPPPPAPPADTLVLTGAGLDGAAGPVSLTVAVGERTFTANATRKGLGDGLPAEYALHGFAELVPEPQPQFETVLADAPPDPRDIAVVRLPLTDADGSVVGYELVVDDDDFAGLQATAGLLLDAFGDIGLERLSGRHPAWVTMTPEFLLEVGTPPVRPDRVVLQLTAGPPSAEVLAALQRLQFSGYTLVLPEFDQALAPVCSMLKVPVAGRSDEELRSAVEAPLAAGLQLVATGVPNHAELVRARALGFTLPREVESVHEALTLLGTATVRRWATARVGLRRARGADRARPPARAHVREAGRRRRRRALHRRALLGGRRAARRADGRRPRDAAVLR